MARAAPILGDRWTLVILVEMFIGTSRFCDLRDLTGSTGPMLSSRLKRLRAEGLITRHAHGGDNGGVNYVLTSKGRDTLPILLALFEWGATWCTTIEDPHAICFRHDQCGGRLQPHGYCSICARSATPVEVDVELSSRFAAERRRRLEASRRDARV